MSLDRTESELCYVAENVGIADSSGLLIDFYTNYSLYNCKMIGRDLNSVDRLKSEPLKDR